MIKIVRSRIIHRTRLLAKMALAIRAGRPLPTADQLGKYVSTAWKKIEKKYLADVWQRFNYHITLKVLVGPSQRESKSSETVSARSPHTSRTSVLVVSGTTSKSILSRCRPRS